jgi:hypothetical protein
LLLFIRHSLRSLPNYYLHACLSLEFFLYLSSATSLGILMLQPLFATPAEKSCIDEVSWTPTQQKCRVYLFKPITDYLLKNDVL